MCSKKAKFWQLLKHLIWCQICSRFLDWFRQPSGARAAYPGRQLLEQHPGPESLPWLRAWASGDQNLISGGLESTEPGEDSGFWAQDTSDRTLAGKAVFSLLHFILNYFLLCSVCSKWDLAMLPRLVLNYWAQMSLPLQPPRTIRVFRAPTLPYFAPP